MVIPIVHIGRLYEHKINIILIMLLRRTGMPYPKELSNDAMPHPKETSTLKDNNLEGWHAVCGHRQPSVLPTTSRPDNSLRDKTHQTIIIYELTAPFWNQLYKEPSLQTKHYSSPTHDITGQVYTCRCWAIEGDSRHAFWHINYILHII